MRPFPAPSRHRLTPATSAVFLGLLWVGCADDTVLLPCDSGERRLDGICVPADTLQLNIDERTDTTCRVDEDAASGFSCATRRGIGVNACPVRAFAPSPELVDGDCAVLSHAGEAPEETFAGDGGAIFVGLVDGPVTLAPVEDQHCYASDLLPSRDELFVAGDGLGVQGLGGADFPAFRATLRAPAPIILDRPDHVVRGAPLRIAVDDSDADQRIVSLSTYDADADLGVRIFCQTDDRGDVVIPAALTAALQETATARLVLLRQNIAHREAGADAPDIAGVVEAAATVSEVVTLPLQ